MIGGRSADGTYVTLLRPREVGSQFGGGDNQATYDAACVITGHNFTSLHQIKFSRIQVTLSNIDEVAQSTDLYSIENKRSMRIVYRRPRFAAYSSGGLTFCVTPELNQATTSQQSIQLTQTLYVDIRSRASKSLDELLDLVKKVQAFFTLAAIESSVPLSIKLWNNRSMFDEFNGIRYRKSANLYFGTPPRARAVQLPLHSAFLLFTLNDLEKPFGWHFEKWSVAYDRARPAFDLYFSTFQRPIPFVEIEFLNLTQVVEIYHRQARTGAKHMPDRMFGPIFETLKGAIPSDATGPFKSDLIARFRHGNEYTLRTRLGELLDELGPLIGKYISDRSEFAVQVVKERNSLTHRGTSGVTSQVLHGFNERLRVLLQAAFLLDAGFSQAKAQELMTRTRRYDHIA